MKSPLLIATLWLASFSAPEAHGQDRLIDEIESRVALPYGARSLAEYARFYAEGESGRIIGVYVLPSPPLAPDAKCTELGQHMKSSRPAPCPSFAEPPWLRAKAGHRVWLEDRWDLPAIDDGGCSVVTIVYHPARQEVEHVYCNGDA